MNWLIIILALIGLICLSIGAYLWYLISEDDLKHNQHNSIMRKK